MGDFGLVLTGTLRNVSERTYRTEDGEQRHQTVAIVDTGRDYLEQVSIRKDDAGSARRVLEPLIGSTVALDVSVGNFRRLWFNGVL
ncbi:MAG: hypothetical protein RBR02_09865 [Desulfuromonadaceae bacterium]|nr:hypothetical protein [Desulfuromonadaceae bacterium]